MARFGAEVFAVSSARILMIIAGRLRKMALRDAPHYDQMPEPVGDPMGACARAAGCSTTTPSCRARSGGAGRGYSGARAPEA